VAEEPLEEVSKNQTDTEIRKGSRARAKRASLVTPDQINTPTRPKKLKSLPKSLSLSSEEALAVAVEVLHKSS